MVWCGMVWHGMVYGVAWYGVPWYGVVWYGVAWYGMAWHDSLPDQLTALFEIRNTDNNYNFSHVRYNSNLGRNSVRYRGPIVWNLIPKAIKDASSLQLFKQKLRPQVYWNKFNLKKKPVR